ncbi:MAG TPA: GNAT family N-acetyltransferase [Steroidobacter sp.]
MQLKHTTKLAHAPVKVVNLAMEGHLELRRQHDHVLEFLTGNESTLWAEDDRGRPLGVLLWTPRRFDTCWWVELAYVPKSLRRAGVFWRLRERMYELAKEAGVQCIESIVSIDNEAVIGSFDKRGQAPANFHYRSFVR